MRNRLALLLDFTGLAGLGGRTLAGHLQRAVLGTRPAESSVITGPDTDAPSNGDHSWLERHRWLERGLPAHAADVGADVVFVGSGFVSAQLARVKATVATTNNMLPFMPAELARYPRFGLVRARMCGARLVTARCLARADRLVLHSQHALETLSNHVPGLAAKTDVALTGVSDAIRNAVENLPSAHPLNGRPYFLYLSPLKRYKNHDHLLSAYAELRRQLDLVPDLYLAGYAVRDSWSKKIQDLARQLGLGPSVHFVGPLDRRDLFPWMHHATINVFASSCETNSIIQAEILGAGGVLACSEVPPMTEVAGRAAEYFDPHDPESIHAALSRLCGDPARREELRTLARARADELSWVACGEAIWRAAALARSSFAARHR